MAKGNKQGPVVHEKVKRGKTPAQLAKTMDNIAAAKERLAKQQVMAKTAKQLRERHGFVGSDDTVIATYISVVVCDTEMWLEEKRTAYENRWVDYALATLEGKWSLKAHFYRFVAGRPLTYRLVKRFFDKPDMPSVVVPAVVPLRKAA